MQFKFILATIFFFYDRPSYISVRAFVPLLHTTPRQRTDTHILQSSINDDDHEEWRLFRARLVQNGLPTIESIVSNHETSGTKPNSLRYAHVTPLVEVGSILISIPTTDLCQAIEQQYWHRSVVVITQISENIVAGSVEDTVPEEQLAQGAKRGRWSYRGLLLNRCTNRVLGENDHDGNPTTLPIDKDAINEENVWRIERGGDLLGLESSAGTEFTCLHNLGISDPNVASVSTKLVGSLCKIPVADAKLLCKDHPEKYKPTDFMTYGGFCAWRPGQLEREMGDERGEWLVLSVDGQSIWDQLQDHHQDLVHNFDWNETDKRIALGTDMWRKYLTMINMSEYEAIVRLPCGQLNFYDQMLQVWAEEYMFKEILSQPSERRVNDSSNQIGAGTLVRAKSSPSNEMLLYDAEFIRSLILVLEDTTESTVGIILNLPMSAAVECIADQEALPLRYGGPIDVMSWRDGSYRDTIDSIQDDIAASSGNDVVDEDIYTEFLNYYSNDGSFDDMDFNHEVDADVETEDDTDESQFVWIHRDSKVGGVQLGHSGFWLVEEDVALLALQAGFLSMGDVMVFAGVCIWEKGEGLGQCKGGLREQIDVLESFEIVQGCNGAQKVQNNDIISAWDILSKNQEVLTKDMLDLNINSAIEGWGACVTQHAESSMVDSKTKLSDAVLKAWVAVNLLDEPLETLVVVDDDQNTDKHLI